MSRVPEMTEREREKQVFRRRSEFLSFRLFPYDGGGGDDDVSLISFLLPPGQSVHNLHCFLSFLQQS